MFQMKRFSADAATSAGHLPLGTAKLSPRASMIASRTRDAVTSTMARKASTGSSSSAILNNGQLVPQTSVSVPSSASTFGDTRFMTEFAGEKSGLVFFGRLQIAAVDAPGAVGQLRHRIKGGDRPAVGTDDMDFLRDLAVQGHDLAEVELLGAIYRLIALAHHVHEDLGRAEHAANRGRGVAEGGVAVVAPEGIDLGLDDVADRRAVGRRNVLGLRAERQADEQTEEGEQAKGHDLHPTPVVRDTRPQE